jgi:hypothetical protein
MTWIIQHKRGVRLAVLALLIIAVVGPWGYTRDGVPPAEWCRPPFLLLENGSCVGQVSGAFYILFSIATFSDPCRNFFPGKWFYLIWRCSPC